MTRNRLVLPLVCAVALWVAPQAEARVLGGKNPKSDCYVVYEGVTGTAPNVECSDGSSCDSDGVVNDSCTFAMNVCVFATGVDGCTPATVTKLKGSKFLTNLPTLPASTLTCGQANNIVVPLKKKKKKTLNGKKAIVMNAITDGGKPKKDPDKFNLVCKPKAGTPVPGDRIFSIFHSGTPDPEMGSHFFSSVTGPSAPVESVFDGTINLRAGTPGADGVATLEVTQDAYLHFDDIGGGSDCIKIVAAGSMGKLDCDGGTPVGTSMTQDSGGPGAGGVNGPTMSTFEEGAPGGPGDGYVRAMVQAVTCGGVLGIPGACPGGLPLSAEECADTTRVDYSKGFVYDLALTTGQAHAEITRERLTGNTQQITVTGQPFDCTGFVGENAPGVLVMPLDITDIPNVGDAANVAKLVD